MTRYRESWRFILGFGVFTVVVHVLGTLLRIGTESWWWTAEPWLLLGIFLTLVYRRDARSRPPNDRCT